MRGFSVILIACTSAMSQAYAAVNIPAQMVCKAIKKQPTCGNRGICIDDPRGMDKNKKIKLNLKRETYEIDNYRGKLTFVKNDIQRDYILNLNPPIFGASSLELFNEKMVIVLTAPDYKYTFQCKGF